MRVSGAVAALLLCLSAAHGALPAAVAGVRPWGQGVPCSRRADGGRGCPSLRLRGGIANLAAYMLLKLGGTENPTVEDVKGVLESVGAHVQEELIQQVCERLHGKDLDEMIEEGRKKQAATEKELATVLAIASGQAGGGGGGGGGGAAAAVEGKGDKGADNGGKKEDKKEKEKEESSMGGMGGEGSDGDMGFGLFD